MIGGQVELSLGGIGTLGAMLLAYLLTVGVPWYLALICALIACGACGAVNAFMVNKMHFPTFIATLGMASVSQGVAYIISLGKNIDIKDPVFAFIGTERLANYIPYSIFIAIIALVVYGIILKKTKYGRSIYLIGGNAEAARLAGLKPSKITFSLFINAGCLAGIAGIMLASRLKTSTCDGISAQQFSGLTAAVLGGISFGGGSGGMGGAFVGILILNVFDNGMQLMAVPTYWQTVASGLLLIAALIFDRYVSSRGRSA
jgi:ribose/xylose/arabinose/galactoside ABC-type transport system permease subunit